MKTDITINATSAVDGKKVTNKISYVNPNIKNSQAIELAQAFNNLTTNSYTSTTRTDTTDCDSEPEKQTRVPTFRYQDTDGEHDLSANGVINIALNKVTQYSSGQKFMTIITTTTYDAVMNVTDLTLTGGLTPSIGSLSTYQSNAATNQNKWSVSFKFGEGGDTYTPPFTGTLKISFPESPTYKEFEKTITINVTAGE